MPQVNVNDISMYYEIHGSGEPIVFIAGFSADHTVWSALVNQFKDDYQVILFDNRGAGQTDVPAGAYSIDQMANDVVQLCAEIGINRAHFVGNSMGGFILQTLVFRHPDLVKSATISHSTMSIKTCFHIYISAQLELLKAAAPQSALIKASCSWLFSFKFLSQPGMLDDLIQLGLANPFPFTLRGYEGQYAALEQFNSTDWINKIHVPTLVLASDQDLIFSELSVKLIAEQIPNATYYCFFECGHLPQIEYPEKLASIIREFIQTIS